MGLSLSEAIFMLVLYTALIFAVVAKLSKRPSFLLTNAIINKRGMRMIVIAAVAAVIVAIAWVNLGNDHNYIMWALMAISCALGFFFTLREELKGQPITIKVLCFWVTVARSFLIMLVISFVSYEFIDWLIDILG